MSSLPPRHRPAPGGPCGARHILLTLAVAAALPIPSEALSAQTLPLKRDVPGAGSAACPPASPAEASATPEERAQAEELGSLAAQAVILGEADRARELLDRATQLDPRSAELAYQYGRVLEGDGQAGAAVDAYCRALALDPAGGEAEDARLRVEALRRSERETLPGEAVTAFRTALDLADQGRLEPALEALDAAVASAPEWAEAIYDRGVLRSRAGRSEGARADLRRYLELRPDAPDANAVSEAIGRLETPVGSRPSPGATLLLGLVPSAGHFYSGRPVAGLGVLALVGGAVATAYLVEDVEVLCLSDPGPDDECPPGHVLDERTERPYLAAGLGVAAAVTVIGAVEAFVRVRRRNEQAADLASLEVGGVRVVGPRLERSGGGRLGIRLLQIRH